MKTTADLTGVADGVYEIETDRCNKYVVIDGAYYIVHNRVYERLTDDNTLALDALIKLKEAGYTVDDIKRMREAGLI